MRYLLFILSFFVFFGAKAGELDNLNQEELLNKLVELNFKKPDIDVKSCNDEKKYFSLPFEISKITLQDTANEIASYVNDGICNIILLTDSSGGSILSALGFRDFLISMPQEVKITTIVTDYCNSACTVIYTAGDKRTYHRDATFLFHSSQSNRPELIGFINEKWLKIIEETDSEFAQFLKSNNAINEKYADVPKTYSAYFIKSNFKNWIKRS